jgi:hypothetical protein
MVLDTGSNAEQIRGSAVKSSAEQGGGNYMSEAKKGTTITITNNETGEVTTSDNFILYDIKKENKSMGCTSYYNNVSLYTMIECMKLMKDILTRNIGKSLFGAVRKTPEPGEGEDCVRLQ